MGPFILDLMWLGVPRKCNYSASQRHFCVFVLDEVQRIVKDLAGEDILED